MDIIKDSDIKLFHGLADRWSLFQAEIMAILKEGQRLLGCGVFPKKLLIYSDIQAADKSLKNDTLSSLLVHDCRDFLREISNRFHNRGISSEIALLIN